MCQLKPQTLAIIQRVRCYITSYMLSPFVKVKLIQNYSQEDLDGSTFLQWRLDEMRMVGISSSQCKRINELQRRLLRTSQIPPSFSHHQSPSSTMSHGRKPNLFSLNAGLNIRASSRSPSRSPAEAARTRTASPKRKNEAVRNATLRSKRARATASNRASSAPPPSDFGLVEGNGLDFQIPGEVNNFGDRFVADLLSPDVKSHASDDSGFSIRAPPLDVERSSRVPVMASIVPRRPKSARRPRNSLSKGGDSARSYATTASTVTAPNVRSKSHTSLFRSTNYRMDQKDEEMKTPPIYKQEQSHKLNWSDDDKLMDVDLFGSKDLPPLFSDLPGGPTSNQDELDTPKPKEEKKSTVGDKSTVTAEIDEDFWSHLKADNNLENFLPLIDRDATPMKPEDLKLPVTLDISPASKFQLALTSPRNNFPKNAQKHMKYWTKHKIEPGMTLEYDRLLVDP